MRCRSPWSLAHDIAAVSSYSSLPYALLCYFDLDLAPFAAVLLWLLCGWQQVLATASAVSRANMATSDWLRPFDFDKVFWSPNESTPNEPSKGDGDDGSASVFSTQQSVYEGLGERIVEDVLNVSGPVEWRGYAWEGSTQEYSLARVWNALLIVCLDEGVVLSFSALIAERESSRRAL